MNDAVFRLRTAQEVMGHFSLESNLMYLIHMRGDKGIFMLVCVDLGDITLKCPQFSFSPQVSTLKAEQPAKDSGAARPGWFARTGTAGG